MAEYGTLIVRQMMVKMVYGVLTERETTTRYPNLTQQESRQMISQWVAYRPALAGHVVFFWQADPIAM